MKKKTDGKCNYVMTVRPRKELLTENGTLIYEVIFMVGGTPFSQKRCSKIFQSGMLFQ